MSYDTPVIPNLFELLARSWSLPGMVEDLCFNRDGSSVAFAAAGKLAIVPIADAERPESRMRVAADTSRQTILPRKEPVRPAAEVGNVTGPVVPYGGKSFLTGSAKGGLVSVTPRGQAVPIAVKLDGALAALARDPASDAVAVGSGASVIVLPDDAATAPMRLDIGEAVTALGFAPQEHLLAVAYSGGVSLWQGRARIADIPIDGAPVILSWSPDGTLLACGFAGSGFSLIRIADSHVDKVTDYPTDVRSFGWSPATGTLATSGAFRTVVWSVSPEGRGAPLEAGRTGLTIVDRVDACPSRPLVAAGYASGLVCLAQIGGREEMLLRGTGGAVTALAWAADGSHLAVGDVEGGAALISFPPGMFK